MHLVQHVPDQAASHISQAEAPPPWALVLHSDPVSATAASAQANPSAGNMGPAAAAAAAAVAAEHYSLAQTVLLALDMDLQRGMWVERYTADVRRAEAWHLRIRRNRCVCARASDFSFARLSGDGGGGDVRAPLLLLLRGGRALLCAWSVRAGGSPLQRVRARRR